MARSQIAGALRGALQWLGVGVVAVAVVLLGLLWPDDESAAPSGGAEAVVAGAARTVVAPPDVAVLAEETHDPDAPPRAPVDPEAGEETEEELLDALEAEADAAAAVEEVAPVEVPPGVITKIEGKGEWVTHTVAPLESVEQIAHRYDVRPESLRMWNGIRARTTRLKPGMRIKVKAHRIPPQRVKLEYIVKPKDSWWAIGTRYGVDSVDLRSHNREAPRRLKVGQKIRMWIDPVVFEWIAVEDDNDPQTLRPGAVGIGPPDNGQLVNGVQLPRSDYYTLRLPPSSYGTTHAVAQLQQGIVMFQARSDYPRRLTFGSMSRKHGGPLTGHKSHQTGRDLDIRLPIKMNYPDRFAVEPKRVDWVALWHLITAFKDTDQAVVVFLDYAMQKPLFRAAARAGASDEERKKMLQWPKGNKAPGFVRDSPGHDKHIHVRFTCGIYEVECSGIGADEIAD